MKGIFYFLNVLVIVFEWLDPLLSPAPLPEPGYEQTERLKRELLRQKIATEEARAAKMMHDSVIADLKIQKLRKELGEDAIPFTPRNYD